MKVSLVQMNSISDKAANIAAAEALIERAVAEESPDWILLPEQFDWAGGKRADKIANAEDLPGGPAYAMAKAQAKKHRVFVHAGSIMERIEARTASTTPPSSSTAMAKRSRGTARFTCSTSRRRAARPIARATG